MARADNNGILISLVVGGAALYYLYQRQQALAASVGVSNSITGDIAQFSQNVINTVENATIGNTRGERNNNPGNIRHAKGWPAVQDQPWQGMSATQTDTGFIQFDDVLHGIRSLHVLLNTYYQKYGLDTVAGIITRYAPAADKNNTAAYIANVSKSMGVGPSDQLNMTSLDTLTAMVHGIIAQENGSDPYLATGQLQQAMAL